jgi:2-amino-4-hydroxy-6-hydroxymethyldihydropteridine diphosphokinase
MEFGFSLGSNLGDRLQHLAEARDRLVAEADTELAAQSPIYETEPVDVAAEYSDLKFLNAVIVIESTASAQEWLRRLGHIEDDMGRKRTADRNAPRPIDIDILYAGDLCIDGGGLVVPHPRWAEREFVVKPLGDVRPDLVLPGFGRKVADIMETVAGTGGLTVYADTW